jgi:restriction system protein
VQQDIVRWALARAFLAAIGQAIGATWPVFVCFAVLLSVALVVTVSQERRLARSNIAAIDQMDGRTFERRLALLFTGLGYQVEETPYSGDYGADLVIGKDGKRIAVQAKRSTRPIGVKAVQEVVGAKDFYRCTDSLVVTNNTYTAQARKLAEATGTELWDRRRLIAALLRSTGTVGTVRSTVHTGYEQSADCRTCGKVVSPKVLAFCLGNADRFGGYVYCFDHQRRVQPIDPVTQVP